MRLKIYKNRLSHAFQIVAKRKIIQQINISQNRCKGKYNKGRTKGSFQQQLALRSQSQFFKASCLFM